MDDNTAKLIKELADKLGTTADHLWGILVRQAPIAACTTLLTYGVFAVLLAACWVGAYKFVKGDNEDADDWFPLWFMLGCMTLLWAGLLLSDAGIIAAGFFNPEFWAFKQIVK